MLVHPRSRCCSQDGTEKAVGMCFFQPGQDRESFRMHLAVCSQAGHGSIPGWVAGVGSRQGSSSPHQAAEQGLQLSEVGGLWSLQNGLELDVMVIGQCPCRWAYACKRASTVGPGSPRAAGRLRRRCCSTHANAGRWAGANPAALGSHLTCSRNTRSLNCSSAIRECEPCGAAASACAPLNTKPFMAWKSWSRTLPAEGRTQGPEGGQRVGWLFVN